MDHGPTISKALNLKHMSITEIADIEVKKKKKLSLLSKDHNGLKQHPRWHICNGRGMA